MTAEDYAFALASHFEGFRSAPYRDPAGYWTIGYGERFLPSGPVTADTPAITQAQGAEMLRARLADLVTEIGDMVKPAMNTAQTGAIVDFCYNMGLEAFRFSTLRRHLELGDYDLAMADLLEWDHAHVDGAFVVLPGLRARREAEAHLFTTGELLPGIA